MPKVNLGDPVNVAGIDETDDHLLALRRDLHDLEPPMQQHEEGSSNLPLPEHRSPPWDMVRGRAGDDVVELGLTHGAEYRQRLNEATVEIRHVRP